MSFTHRNEGFVCVACGKSVSPAAATCRNHCPSCLASLHVDTAPGDRANPCRGQMIPVNWQYDSKKWVILDHRCTRCGAVTRNRSAPDDDLDAILAIQRQP